MALLSLYMDHTWPMHDHDFLRHFLGQCLDHNSAPLRSFETKILPSEAEFRGAGREIGPEL